MKKLVILFAAAICSGSAFAVNGPYVGVGLGYSDTIFNVDHRATATTGHSGKSFQGTAGGAQGQLIAGYAYDINKFRLGAEITVQMPKTTHIDDNSTDNSYYYEFIYAYGINFVPNYYLTDRNSVYLKIGATRGKFAYKNLSNTKDPILDTSFYSTGLNLGFGTAMYLTKNIRLKLEYLYTNYATQKINNNIAPEGVKIAIETKIQPQVHTVMLGADYQFDLF